MTLAGRGGQLQGLISVCSGRAWVVATCFSIFMAVPVPGYAAARSRDQVATKAYLGALYQLLHSEQRNLPTSKDQASELIHTVARGCSAAVIGVHRTKQAGLLSLEVGGALAVVMTRPDRPDIVSFVRTVGALRWSDRRVTSRVRAYLHKLTAGLRSTHVPNLCSGVMVWVRSGFQKVDAETTEFVRERQIAEAGPEAVPTGLFSKYEEGKDRPLLQKIKKAERYLEGPALNALLAAWGQLLKIIGLP
jgi:hypothetical protein